MKEKISRKILVGAVLIGVLLVSHICIINRKKEINLEGQWKVTEYITDTKEEVSYSFYEHYWGRSITIEPNRIIFSMYCWPDEIAYKVLQYRYIHMRTCDADEFRIKNGMNKAWEEEYAGQEITMLSYGMSKDKTDGWRFFVAENGDVLCLYLNNIYHMERFRHAENDIKIEQLYGQWNVKRLISYQDGWRGNNAVLGEAQKWRYYIEYDEEDGANFYPGEYLGNRVVISDEGMELYQDEKLLEGYDSGGYSSKIVDKYDYQSENQIYDELGIENKSIQVFAGKKQAGGKLLNGDMVIINKDEIIVKIYQGWYLLEKQYS